jgi:hypothetical protein
MANVNPTVDEVEADPAKPYKAYAAAALTFVTIVIADWIGDSDGTTTKEFLGWCVEGIVGSGLTGGATFAVRNPKRLRRR